MIIKFWHIYMFSGHLNIYSIFKVMYVCMCVWTWQRLNGAFNWAWYLVCILQVTIGWTLLILVNIGFISFFTGVQKRVLIQYGLWNEIHKNVLITKGCLRFSSNLVYTLGAVQILRKHIFCNFRHPFPPCQQK